MQSYFDRMVKAGCDCVVMEVSSQGLDAASGRPAFRLRSASFTTSGAGSHRTGMSTQALKRLRMHCKGLLFQPVPVLASSNVDDEHLEHGAGRSYLQDLETIWILGTELIYRASENTELVSEDRAIWALITTCRK